MKKILFMLAIAATAWAVPMTYTESAWQGNPIFWRFQKDTIQVCALHGSHLALCDAVPVASNVVFSATFVPEKCGTNSWRLAGIALVQDQQNYWKLSLALTPPEQGGKPFIEFCEMLGGEWLSQANLKVIKRESQGEWSFAKTYQLSIVLTSESICGILESDDKQVRFVQQYGFGNSPAVRSGRPALASSGIVGRYTKLDVAYREPAPITQVQKQYPPYSVPPNTDIIDRGTGFFRVIQKADGRWWTIDPNGFGCVLLGVDHVTFWGHYCQKLGYAPHFRKNQAKFPDRRMWESETLDRLTSWGFNMLGAGCAAELMHRGLVHTVFLSLGDSFGSLGGDYEIAPQEQRPCSVFPNVFHPDFERYCLYQAHVKCTENRMDPWLLGYFIDNELAWWGRGALDTGLFDYALAKPDTHAVKPVLVAFLKAQAGNDVAVFNRCWGTQLASFDQLAGLTQLPSNSEAQKQVKLAFLKLAADRYFSITTRAIRTADPNHLILGARFAGTLGAHPTVWEASGKYCDIVTFNMYPMADLDDGQVYVSQGRNRERVIEHVQKFYDYVKRPMLITEWSFPALDSGLPCRHGAGQRFMTQAERTEATSLFARTMLSMPYLLGYDYFMWVDEPALGISEAFPEDSNYGLINEDGKPYAQITDMFRALHQQVNALRRSGPPVAKTAPKRALTAAADRAELLMKSRTGAAGFHATEETLCITNGQLRLVIKKGNTVFIPDVELAGTRLGNYTAMIHAPNLWVNVERVNDFKVTQRGAMVVADIRGETHHPALRAEVVQRIYVLPDVPYFIAEVVQVKNIGTAALALNGIFFRPMAAYAVSPKVVGVPNLWKRPIMGYWVDQKEACCYGAFAPAQSDMQINFWVDPQGNPHADARIELSNQTLAPQAVFVPQPSCYVFCLLGKTGPADWENYARAVLQ